MSGPGFTPEEVRAALLAAGHPEHAVGVTEGFVVTDARKPLDEIIVEVRRVLPSSGEYPPWDDAAKAHEQAILGLYQAALDAAGYFAGTPRTHYSMLIVKEGSRA
jgi:hypothetical protein